MPDYEKPPEHSVPADAISSTPESPPRTEAAREIVVEAATIEAAVKAAATKLDCKQAQVRHRVLQEEQRGMLGFGVRPARIKAWRHDPLERQLDQALQMVRDMDGHHRVEIAGRDILLTVYPPIGAGKAMTWKKALMAVKEYDPAQLDEFAVMQTVDEADTKPHAVAHLREAGERDGKFLVHVAPDCMAVDVTLIPPRKGGREVDMMDLRNALVRDGIVFGIDPSALEVAQSEWRYNVPIRIAQGVAPIAPESGRIEYLFARERPTLRGHEDAAGRVDHRELGLIHNVKSGDVLAQRIPARGGVPGRDVRGRVIQPPPPVEAVFPEGENVLSDGETMKAGIDGHVALVRDRVVIAPVYHVKGDVNYGVGNIDFQGTVCVDGLVEDAFHIQTGGSLFVRKSIGKCQVRAGGNVVVVGGILGRHEAEVIAGGDLVALFVEHARLDVGGNLVVEEVILHSDALVGGDLVMSGERASIVGGTTIVGGDITVRSIGGESTARSHVRAGVPRGLVIRERLERAELLDLEERVVKLEETLRVVDHKSTAYAAGGPLQSRINQLRSNSAQIHARIHSLRDSLRSIDREIDAYSTRAVIHVIEMAMPGTRIEIGTAALVLNAPVQYATFRKHGGEVRVYPYEGSLGAR